MSHSIQPVLFAHGRMRNVDGSATMTKVAAALHLLHREAAAGREHRINRAVRSVLGKQRRGHCDAGAHRAGASDASSVLPRSTPCWSANEKPHDLEFFFLDVPLDLRGRLCLRVGPQAVASTKLADLTRTRAGIQHDAGWQNTSVPVRPARSLALARLGLLPVALPVVGGANAVDRRRTGHARGLRGVERP